MKILRFGPQRDAPAQLWADRRMPHVFLEPSTDDKQEAKERGTEVFVSVWNADKAQPLDALQVRACQSPSRKTKPTTGWWIDAEQIERLSREMARPMPLIEDPIPADAPCGKLPASAAHMGLGGMARRPGVDGERPAVRRARDLLASCFEFVGAFPPVEHHVGK